MTWSGLILPYIEQSVLYDSLAPKGIGMWTGNNLTLLQEAKLGAYQCPSAPETRETFNDGRGVNPRYRSNYNVAVAGLLGCTVCPNGPGGDNVCDCWEQHFDDWGPTDPRYDGAFAAGGNNATPISYNFANMVDGTSSTIFAGEVCRVVYNGNTNNFIYIGGINPQDQFGRWSSSTGHPINSPDTGIRGMTAFRSYHPGGAQFLLGDGSSRLISENVDRILYVQLGTGSTANRSWCRSVTVRAWGGARCGNVRSLQDIGSLACTSAALEDIDGT